MIDLRHGDWRTALAGVTCDALVTDPPYGDRVHSFDSNVREDGYAEGGLRPDYAAWTPADVSEFVSSWSPRVSGWIVTLTSHDLIPAWEAAHAAVDRYCFAPVPCVIRGMSCRMLGDGPSSWTVYAIAARPKEKRFMSWGTLSGAYVGSTLAGAGGGRGKPDWLMSALVRDYSRRGDMVCDPLAGWGGVLAVAQANDRRAIGAEVDDVAYAEAIRRLKRPQQVDLFATMGGA